jgi:hypothetical protein
MLIMSSELEKLLEAGREHGAVSGGPITKILIETAYKGYAPGSTDFWQYCKVFHTPEDGARVAEELNARIRKDGGTFDASFGFKITLNKDVLTRDTPYANHLYEFISDYKKADFALVLDAINDNNLPVNKEFWGRFQWRTSPWSEAKGDAGKTDTDQNGEAAFPTIRLPVEKFDSEQEARAAAASSGVSTTGVSSSQWSETAMRAYPAGNLPEEEILKFFEDAKKGIPFTGNAENFPLPVPNNELTCMKYIADIYNIEASDIEKMIPF